LNFHSIKSFGLNFNSRSTVAYEMSIVKISMVRQTMVKKVAVHFEISIEST
jgi:hypothetical protein